MIEVFNIYPCYDQYHSVLRACQGVLLLVDANQAGLPDVLLNIMSKGRVQIRVLAKTPNLLFTSKEGRFLKL